MLKDLCNYIVASGNLSDLVIGQTLYAGSLPQDAPHLCTVITEANGAYVIPTLKDQWEYHFQIFTRGLAYMTAYDEAYRIFYWLVNQMGVDLTDHFVHNIQGIAPGYIGQDEKFRYLFSANIMLKVRKK